MDLASHLRRTFLAGGLAAVPIVTTVVAVAWIEGATRPLAPSVYGYKVPFFGLIVAVASVYLLGLVVSTALAKVALTRLDKLLQRLPLLSYAYRAWKDVTLTTSASGMWDKVVLVQYDDHATLGFTSGVPVPGSPNLLVVFIPSAPLPTSGTLHLLAAHRCTFLDLSTEDAFKHYLSGGNHLPPALFPPNSSNPL